MLLVNVEAARNELLRAYESLHDVKQQQGPEAANATRAAVYGAFERLLSALEVEVPDDAREQVDALLALGPDDLKEALLRVEEVTGLERKRRSCADPWPSAELPQVQRQSLLRRLCGRAGTRADQKAGCTAGCSACGAWCALPRPPPPPTSPPPWASPSSRGGCARLDRQAMVWIAAVELACDWHALGLAGLFKLLLGGFAFFVASYFVEDVEARKASLEALQKPLPVRVLRARLQQHPPANMAPSLRAVLGACVDRCAATLQHDTERLRQLELQQLEWRERPFRTLVCALCGASASCSWRRAPDSIPGWMCNACACRRRRHRTKQLPSSFSPEQTKQLNGLKAQLSQLASGGGAPCLSPFGPHAAACSGGQPLDAAPASATLAPEVAGPMTPVAAALAAHRALLPLQAAGSGDLSASLELPLAPSGLQRSGSGPAVLALAPAAGLHGPSYALQLLLPHSLPTPGGAPLLLALPHDVAAATLFGAGCGFLPEAMAVPVVALPPPAGAPPAPRPPPPLLAASLPPPAGLPSALGEDIDFGAFLA
eukprot:scaffold15.g4345.t1